MTLMPNDALHFLHECEFHLYHAKSWNESLFIHSFSAYSLVHNVLPFTQVYAESDKEVMRWAALLHDYGKTSANWQKAGDVPADSTAGSSKLFPDEEGTESS
jgi:hypothetical protein